MKSFRKTENLCGDYGKKLFDFGFATKGYDDSELLAEKLYLDEAAIISSALQIEKISHTVTKKEGKYRINIPMELVAKNNRCDRLIFALQSAISSIIGRAVVWYVEDVNELKMSEDGLLDKINSRVDTESYIEIITKLTEYIQKVFKEE